MTGMLVMGALGLAAGIGSSVASGVAQDKAAQEQKKKLGLINQQMGDNESFFNRKFFKDITDRTDVINALRLLTENQDKQRKRNAAQAAVSGASTEQQLAQDELLNSQYADAIGGIASSASQLHDQYMNEYQQNKNNYYAQRLGLQDTLSGIYGNQATQSAQAATNLFQSGGSMLGQGLAGKA